MGNDRNLPKGVGSRSEILQILAQDYRSAIVDWMQTHGRRLEHGGTAVVLAREFGFCYGVDRAVEYAYETRRRFPDRRIFITGEIIHNPLVNRRLREMGILQFPSVDRSSGVSGSLTPDDVVLIPAFGIEQDELTRLRGIGVVLVDTTCGSVLNVWKSVGRYARDGVTSVIPRKGGSRGDAGDLLAGPSSPGTLPRRSQSCGSGPRVRVHQGTRRPRLLPG
jgi:4-hydroxy-3-methylbut-2-enyl diphosphate reductase